MVYNNEACRHLVSVFASITSVVSGRCAFLTLIFSFFRPLHPFFNATVGALLLPILEHLDPRALEIRDMDNIWVKEVLRLLTSVT